MATFHNFKCPDCGTEFGFGKGILPSMCDKPVPEQLKEDHPEYCPKCGRKFVLTNPDDRKFETSVMFID